MQFINELSNKNIHEIIDSELILIPIMRNHIKHWCQNQISFVYVYDIPKNSEYIFNLKHSDYANNDLALLDKLQGIKYIYNQQVLPLENSYDLELVYWYFNNMPIGKHKLDSKVYTYYNWYKNTTNVNDIIPIYNFLEYVITIKNIFLSEYSNISIENGIEIYESLHRNLKVVEKNGLHVNTNISLLKFRNPNDILYSEYNQYTTTGRPSNKFGGINFAALPKEGGVRDAFISQFNNGVLIEFDYDSFHLRLASKLINYNLPDGNLHEYFGQQYFNSKALTLEQYENSKALTFKLLNGINDSSYQHITFFNKIYEYREQLWDKFLTDDEIKLPLSKRTLKRSFYDNISASKLFNYVLQATETEFNSIIINRLNTYLLTQNSKLILYTYDSFLIDFDPSDGKQLVKDLQNILNVNGFHVKMKIGYNYGNMISYNKI